MKAQFRDRVIPVKSSGGRATVRIDSKGEAVKGRQFKPVGSSLLLNLVGSVKSELASSAKLAPKGGKS
jgi:hypothetical protein